MTAIQLLSSFAEKGIELWEDEGKLRYRGPKGAMSETMLSELTDKMPQLLSILRHRNKDGQENLPTIIPDPQHLNCPFPLTSLQSAYMLGRGDTFELGNVACHLYFELESHNLDMERLTLAWQFLIDRHDILRAIIHMDSTQQILERVPPYKIEVLDLRGKAFDEIQSRLNTLRNRMSHQLFKLDQWPLFELRAIRLDDNLTSLHISIDLLIADFFSVQILLTELSLIYEGRQELLVPLELSFRDYVLAEAGMEESEIYQRARNYWLKRVPTLPPAPDLPLKKDPTLIRKPRFVRRSFILSPDKWQLFKKWASLLELTPSVALLTAYANVLSCWSNSPKFTINMTVFNRLPLHPQVMALVGDFTSVNLLKIDTSHKGSFIERAKFIQSQLWSDLEHRYFSGVRVLREMARSRKGVERVMMPVVFTSTIGLGVSDQNESDLISLGEMKYAITQTPQVWLDYQTGEQNGALQIIWDAVEELFPKGLLDEMFDAYCGLVRKFAEEEDAWQQTSPLLIPAAHLEKRAAVNDTGAPISSEMLHTLFANQVSRRLKQPAVVSNGKILTYEELSRRSNRLSRLLREKGAQPNTLVAVVMEKGWEQVVAVLGILQAGAAYLPIDSDVPKERLHYLLKDGEIRLVLTQSRLEDKCEWPETIECISVDRQKPPKEDEDPLDPIQQPENIAYVIYTSGSTGLPKGVVIDHQGAVNTILDINRRFNIKPVDKILALSNLSFDLSVFDIFGTLAAGGTIIMPDPAGTKDPGHWMKLMRQKQVTIWNSVPILMQMLVEYASGRTVVMPQYLRLVLLSGDWTPLDLPDKIRTLVKDVQVISLGGATEASIWSNLYPIEEVDPNWKSIPYGRPMTNQKLYVLNENMANSPDWVPGNLYISGIGLAKGYWRDEEKTDASFLEHPLTGEHLYRTGDTGRFLPDGNIEFLGREDFQVKIRGYRIELGEIETMLKQHPGVRDAVVMAVGDPRGDKRLVGYVVPERDSASSLFETENADMAETRIRWASLVEAGNQKARDLAEIMDFRRLSIFMNWLEHLSIAYICRALKNLNVFINQQERWSFDNLVQTCRIQPHYRELVHQWLKVLTDEGLLQWEENEVFVNQMPLPSEPESMNIPPEIGKDSIWREHSHNLFQYLQRSSKYHTELLRGNLDPLELFLSDDLMLSPENLTQIIPGNEYSSSILRNVLETVSKGSLPAKPLRILEVGGRTGATTKLLLPVLPPDSTIYTYTDGSPFFTNKAENNFKDYPFVRYQLLDIDRNPQDQGFEAHSFDVIIGVNSLHRARNLGITLEYMRSLAAPGGLFLILEGTHNSYLQMITVGFIEHGFTYFEDERAKDNLPLISPEKWHESLQSVGFEAFAAFPEVDYVTEDYGQHVMAVQAPASVKVFRQAALRIFLQQKLPAYMVPSDYTLMDMLPLTPNGKIDRQALPTHRKVISKPQNTNVNPRTPMEESLADIWMLVLHIDRVGIYDNFFDLGGDSLLANQLVNIFRKRFRIDIPLRSLFEHSTISDLADLIEKSESAIYHANDLEEGLI